MTCAICPSLQEKKVEGGMRQRYAAQSVVGHGALAAARPLNLVFFFHFNLVNNLFFFISFADVGRPHSSSWAMRAICRTSSLVFNLLAILALPGTKKKEYQY